MLLGEVIEKTQKVTVVTYESNTLLLESVTLR